MSFPNTARATVSRLFSLKMTPVGLQGELRTMAFVFSVRQAFRASSVIWKSVLLTSRKTGSAPAAVTMVAYREKAGVGMITWSPGFRMPVRAVYRAWVAPTVTSTSSGAVGLPRFVSKAAMAERREAVPWFGA